MSPRVRVLVVDDSAFVRKVLREVLSGRENIEVVGSARDGLEALEKIAELSPDVMTLDMNMPALDGIGVLEALQARPGPAVIVVSNAEVDSELAIRAFERGAIELVSKPTALATERLYELRDELVAKIEAAAQARQRISVTAAPASMRAPARATRELVVLGCSTGGPQALTSLLPALPRDFPLPVAVALHIPAGYTNALARRIDQLSQLEVVEAEPGIALLPGRVVIARGGSHLRVQRQGDQLVGLISRFPSDAAHLPSVDVLFASAAEHVGRGVIGVVLTGMGSDGRAGAHQIRAAGGLLLTEAESSCVVYGMPRALVEAGLSDQSVTLERLASVLVERA